MSEQLDAKNPETYRKAAGILIERGHTKGLTEDPQGRMCVGGALAYVLYEDVNEWETPEFVAAVGQLLQTVGYRDKLDSVAGLRVSVWNNHQERTPGEVIEGLLATAKRLEEAQADR